MLFKNKLSGNVVSADHPDVIEQMLKSPAYEPVIASKLPGAEVPAPETPEETAAPETPAEEAPAETAETEPAAETVKPKKLGKKTGKTAG